MKLPWREVLGELLALPTPLLVVIHGGGPSTLIAVWRGLRLIAPQARAALDPVDLGRMEPGSVVLLRADPGLAGALNASRNAMGGTRLKTVLWCAAGELQRLRREAPDLMDQVSHVWEEPDAGPPASVVSELTAAPDRSRFSWAGGDLEGALSRAGRAHTTAIDPGQPFAELVAEITATPVRRYTGLRDVWLRARACWAESAAASGGIAIAGDAPFGSWLGATADLPTLPMRLRSAGVSAETALDVDLDSGAIERLLGAEPRPDVVLPPLLADVQQSVLAGNFAIASECARRLRMTDAAAWFSAKAPEPGTPDTPVWVAWEEAVQLHGRGDAAHAAGGDGFALECHQGAAERFETLGDIAAWAVAREAMAEILSRHGRFTEALRIHVEEAIPVFERIGDAMARAIALGRVARVLRDLGRPEEALRIHLDEVIPTFERLGLHREVARARTDVADLLDARGDAEEAARILVEEVAPVLRQVGEEAGLAITLSKLAGILTPRGHAREALRTLRTQVLPVLQRHGDQRALLNAQSRVVDALLELGRASEAFQIQSRTVVPAYEQSGNRRGLAIAQGRTADLLTALGRRTEARRILSEDVLPVLHEIGVPWDAATTEVRLADLLRDEGLNAQALESYARAVEGFKGIGDQHGVAAALERMAQLQRSAGVYGQARETLNAAIAALDRWPAEQAELADRLRAWTAEDEPGS